MLSSPVDRRLNLSAALSHIGSFKLLTQVDFVEKSFNTYSCEMATDTTVFGIAVGPHPETGRPISIV